MRWAQRAANLRRMRRAPAHLQIDIDELVLHGFAASDRNAIGDALSGELERLFGEAELQRAFHRGLELPSMNTGSISLPAQVGPAAVGAEVARVVYSSLNADTQGNK